MSKKLNIIFDNGHGINTPGKRSPKLSNDSQFFEYLFNREIVDSLVDRLKDNTNYNIIKLVPEINDISLNTRIKRINEYCSKYGAKNCIMISVHVNASGHGDWMNARGWSAWTTKGVTISDKLAECLYEAADEVIGKGKYYSSTLKNNQKPIRENKADGDRDWEANFAIIKGAKCCAVLTENFFMDNKEDVNYLISPQGFNDTIDIHIKGIEKYYNKYFNK